VTPPSREYGWYLPSSLTTEYRPHPGPRPELTLCLKSLEGPEQLTDRGRRRHHAPSLLGLGQVLIVFGDSSLREAGG
jgi:hypothetical protein